MNGLSRPPAAFPDALVIVDSHGGILAANAQAVTWLGWDRQAALAR